MRALPHTSVIVMNKKRNPYEMLRLHESGDAPYQKYFVPEDVRKICVELAPSTYLDVGCNRGQLITAVKKNGFMTVPFVSVLK